MSFRSLLSGTGVALVTPFTSNNKIDFNALEKIIDFVIKHGVQYIVTLGTTGETPTLSKDEKIEVALFTYDKVNERVPVVTGLGGNNTGELIKDLEEFPLEKAAAVLSASPYYNKPSQQGLFEHYKALAKASPIPIILYNVPGRTARNIDASTTLQLANEVENIAGIKEASGDILQCMKILKNRPPDFLVVSGDDQLVLPQIACGVDGVISVAANALPEKFSRMIQFALNGDFANAKQLNDEMMEAYELMFAENNPAGVKAFMHEAGLLENNLRLPVVALSENLHKQVKDYLKSF